MTVIKYPKKSLILITIISMIIGLMCVMGIIMTLIDSEKPVDFLFLIFSSFFLLVIIYLVIDSFLLQLRITESNISKRTLLRNLKLSLTEMKGYRVSQGYLIIHPIDRKKNKIYISKYLRYENLPEWFWNNVVNLDELESQKEENEISKITISDDISYEKASKFTNWFNNLGLGIGLYGSFYPYPYNLVILVLAIFPLIGLYLIYKFKDLVRFDGKENSKYLNIVVGFIVPCAALLLRIFLDFDVIWVKDFWYMLIIVTVFLTILIFKIDISLQNKLTNIILVIIITAIYSSAILVHANCQFDSSIPQKFEVNIIDKRISGGKTTSYILLIDPIPEYKSIEEVSVSKEKYKMFEIGENCNLLVFKGFLSFPWYYIDSK